MDTANTLVAYMIKGGATEEAAKIVTDVLTKFPNVRTVATDAFGGCI